jgi:hypothetical protein
MILLLIRVVMLSILRGSDPEASWWAGGRGEASGLWLNGRNWTVHPKRSGPRGLEVHARSVCGLQGVKQDLRMDHEPAAAVSGHHERAEEDPFLVSDTFHATRHHEAIGQA